MGRHRRLWSVVAVACLVVAAAGCGGNGQDASSEQEIQVDEGGGGKPLRVAAFLASSANTYWQAALEGVREAAADAGAEINITVFDSEFDANIQKNQLRDALVSEQFDVWFIGPNDGSALVQEITEAVGKDIAVGCTLVPCGADIRATEVQIDGVVAEAGIPFYENGQHLGELTVEACGDDDPCKVVWMPGLPSLPLEKARTDGLMSVLNEHSNIEVVATQGGEYLAAPALEATQDILQANPDTSVIVSAEIR